MNQPDDKSSRLIFKLIVGCIANVIIYAAFLLLPAPTWQWRRAWIFIGIVFVATVASTVIIYRVNPAVLQERVKPVVQKSQPFADKIATLLLIAAFLGQIIFIPLDVFRFHLMGRPSFVVSVLGLVLYLVGWCIVTLTLMENAFAAPVVKHQAERHHKVIDTGVYSVVRHPMYAGAIFLFIGTPLWLESVAATLLSIILIIILVLRIRLEEQFLRQNLQSYNAYAERVRYRLIPYFW